MKVDDIDYEFTLPADHGAGRSVGLHLGDIIKAYARATGQDKHWGNGSNDPRMNFEKGFIWEDVFSEIWGRRMADRGRNEAGCLVQPEYEVDGIYLTPDLVDLDTDTLDEYKCTTRSMNKFDALETFFDLWLVQIKAYLYAIGIVRCRLIVMFLCGDYKPPFPTPRAKLLTFTQRELDDNWSMVMNFARKLRRERGE